MISSCEHSPCWKQHLREKIATSDWVSILLTGHTSFVWSMVVKSLPNPAWRFLANVVSHMEHSRLTVYTTQTPFSTAGCELFNTAGCELFNTAWCDRDYIPMSSCDVDRHIVIIIISSMWETTFPRNSHAGLGKPINEENILPSMHETSLSPCPIRRGYFSEMLFLRALYVRCG